jgi:hypothetical protein
MARDWAGTKGAEMVRRVLVIAGTTIVAVAIVGCSLPWAKAQAARPKPSPSPSARLQPSPLPEVSPSPPPAPCKIAVSGNQAGSGVFVTFPGGDFVSDPKSDVKPPAGTSNGYGYGSIVSYDYALREWIPAERDSVAPNGSRYALPSQEADGGLYVIDAATGKFHDTATGAFFEIVEWRENGIYAMKLDQSPPTQGRYHGLYVINPDSGAVRSLTTRGTWTVIGPLAAWGYDVATGNQANASRTLLRYDLASNAAAAYFTQPGASPVVIGFDEQDRPLVEATNEVAQQVFVLNGPDQADKVYSGPGYPSHDHINFNGPGVVDSHGLWIGTDHGLMLYTTTGGFKKVSDATGRVGGGCH